MRVIERNRATGDTQFLTLAQAVQIPTSGWTYRCCLYTLNQSDQPRGLRIEFSVLSIDLDFLQWTGYDSIL